MGRKVTGGGFLYGVKKVTQQNELQTKVRNLRYLTSLLGSLLIVVVLGISVNFFSNKQNASLSPNPTPTPNRTGCTRENPYPMPGEFKRAISLIQERFTQSLGSGDNTKIHLNEFYNCLDIQYSDLTGQSAEGFFLFGTSTPNDLRIYVDNSYKGYDDLLTAVLLSHELIHSLQLENYWLEGTQSSCVDKEVQAFEVQESFFTVLNQEELKSLVGRVFSYLPQAPAYSGLNQLLLIKGYGNQNCGSDPTCYWNYIHQQIYNYVVSNPFYQKQCHL